MAAVVLVDDVNSPAATYPTPDERAYAAVPYAVEHAAALARAGARAAAVRYHGTVHDVATLDPLADTPAARGAIAPSLAAVQGALRA